MARQISMSKLNASSLDIINTIRANASSQFQDKVPKIEKTTDIPRVGEVLYGYPALANEFISALVNRIGLVVVNSANFNNPYRDLKKGYLDFGETVEEVFVGIAKAREFSAEKAEAREFKRSIPDVRTALHCINWRVQYPVTIQDNDLRTAFVSADGVTNLINKIVNSIYTAAEYDEYLLFKYLIIKAVAHGKMKPVGIDQSDITKAAVNFRGLSNKLTFMSTEYNPAGVHTVTSKDDQYIFMDAMYNADYDVSVLAAAFNMDKADFTGHLKLIDDWGSFDNERFDVIRANCDMLEEVTAAELNITKDIAAVLVDKEFFQIYDQTKKMSDVQVASGLYWNYFYHDFKVVSTSPFSNAIVFLKGNAPTLPATITVEVTDKEHFEGGTIFTLEAQNDTPMKTGGQVNFVQTEDCVKKLIAVQKYGGYIFPTSATTTKPEMIVNGTKYVGATELTTAAKVGDTITFNKQG